MARLTYSIFAAFAAVATVTAKTIPINVINDVFEPNTTTAAAGDVLEFHFMPNNHSVVMGEFDNACQPAKTGGFYSGFFVVNEGEGAQLFRVQINDTKPMVYYCSQGRRGGGHCQIGMVGVVNPADPGSLQKYVDAARTVELAGSPPGGAFGGMLVPNPNSAGGTSTSGTPTAAPTSTGEPTALPTGAGNMLRASWGGGLVAGIFALLMATR